MNHHQQFLEEEEEINSLQFLPRRISIYDAFTNGQKRRWINVEKKKNLLMS